MPISIVATPQRSSIAVTSSSGGVGIVTDDLGTWYLFRAANAAYYAINVLTGVAVYTHPTDILPVWNSVIAAMPGTGATANTDRAGGRIELGPHVFNTSGPLTITNKRSVTIFGQGYLQQTIIQQNAQFSAGHFVMEIGTSSDNPLLHGFDLADFQVRGKRNDGTITIGGGISIYGSEINLYNIFIQAVNDTGFFMNGTAGGGAAFTNLLTGVNVIGYGRTSVYTAYGIDMGASVSDCDIEDCVVHQEQAYVSAADNGDCGVSGFRNLGGTIRYLHCHAYFNKAHGFEATSAGNLSFLSCISESNRQSGIYINQPKNISIVGGGYYANSFNQTDGSAADSNIYIGNSLQFIITGLTMAKFIGAAPNVPRNIFVDGGSHGLIANCSFADAAADQIVIWNANYINVNNCDFLDALTGTPITGRTPANAVSLNGSSANCKIHDCIIEGSTQILIEMASSWSGNYNEIYNNKVGSGTVTLQDGTTYTSRKWGNRNLTGVKLADRQLGNGGAIGSANDLTLTHGTFFTISNSVQINGIRSAGWDQGSVIILQFLGQPLLKNQGTPSAGFAKLKLSGGADVTPATTNDVFMFVYDGTDFIMCAPFSAIT